MKKIAAFVFTLITPCYACAGYVCLPGFGYSENYSTQTWCNADRRYDFLHGNTYELSCTSGLIFYFYCKKKENLSVNMKKNNDALEAIRKGIHHFKSN